jgi:hypothetical protein
MCLKEPRFRTMFGRRAGTKIRSPLQHVASGSGRSLETFENTVKWLHETSGAFFGY